MSWALLPQQVIAQLAFISPNRLLILLIIPLLILAYIFASLRKNRRGMRFTNTSMLDVVVPKQSQWRRHLAVALTCGVLLAVGVSACGGDDEKASETTPTVTTETETTPTETAETVTTPPPASTPQTSPTPPADTNSGQFAVHFTFDITPKSTGQRITQQEVGLYTVKDGLITREQFFYEGNW